MNTLLDEAVVIIYSLVNEPDKRDVVEWAKRWLCKYELSQQESEECSECQGMGRLSHFDGYDPCTACNGSY